MNHRVDVFFHFVFVIKVIMTINLVNVHPIKIPAKFGVHETKWFNRRSNFTEDGL
jgi:hypothetical protein